MDQLIDFLFCPIHGLFAPRNWPMLAPAIGVVCAYAKTAARVRKTRTIKDK